MLNLFIGICCDVGGEQMKQKFNPLACAPHIVAYAEQVINIIYDERRKSDFFGWDNE